MGIQDLPQVLAVKTERLSQAQSQPMGRDPLSIIGNRLVLSHARSVTGHIHSLTAAVMSLSALQLAARCRQWCGPVQLMVCSLLTHA